MLLHSPAWHQYKHTKLVIWRKCKRVNFQVCPTKKRLRFWHAKQAINSKVSDISYFSFQSFIRCICMSPYIMQYIVQERVRTLFCVKRESGKNLSCHYKGFFGVFLLLLFFVCFVFTQSALPSLSPHPERQPWPAWDTVRSRSDSLQGKVWSKRLLSVPIYGPRKWTNLS